MRSPQKKRLTTGKSEKQTFSSPQQSMQSPDLLNDQKVRKEILHQPLVHCPMGQRYIPLCNHQHNKVQQHKPTSTRQNYIHICTSRGNLWIKKNNEKPFLQRFSRPNLNKKMTPTCKKSNTPDSRWARRSINISTTRPSQKRDKTKCIYLQYPSKRNTTPATANKKKSTTLSSSNERRIAKLHQCW